MTTPTSSLGMSHIQTEFGGSNPISLSEYYGVNANVPSSGVINMSQFLGISNYAASTPDWSLYAFAISPQDISVEMRLWSNGTYHGIEDGTINYAGTWKTGGGTGANYEARFTKMTGSDPTGDVTNTWISLSTNRSWVISESRDGFFSTTCSGHLEIRVASGATLDNSSVSMTCEVET